MLLLHKVNKLQTLEKFKVRLLTGGCFIFITTFQTFKRENITTISNKEVFKHWEF